MFCENCGTELLRDAEYCSNCGVKINKEIKEETKEEKNESKNVPDTEIQLTVRPCFKFWYTAMPYLLVFGGIALANSILFAFISMELAIFMIVIGLILLCIILPLVWLLTKKQYDNVVYDFYKIKIVYKDNFINLSEKEVKYKYIREVTMRQSIVQRFFNIGNVVLFTNAETGGNNGIFIRDVENVQEVYNKIKKVINEYESKNM